MWSESDDGHATMSESNLVWFFDNRGMFGLKSGFRLFFHVPEVLILKVRKNNFHPSIEKIYHVYSKQFLIDTNVF